MVSTPEMLRAAAEHMLAQERIALNVAMELRDEADRLEAQAKAKAAEEADLDAGAKIVFDVFYPKGIWGNASDAKDRSRMVAAKLRDRYRTGGKAKRDLIEALRLTVEYVGTDVLPPVQGWSWYDALLKHAPEVAEALAAIPRTHEPSDAARMGRALAVFLHGPSANHHTKLGMLNRSIYEVGQFMWDQVNG